MNDQKEEQGHEQVIKVTVKLVEGDEATFEFNADQLVGKEKERVLHHFHIEPPSGVKYYFALQGGKLLDDNKTWRLQGIKDGATVLFGTEQQVG